MKHERVDITTHGFKIEILNDPYDSESTTVANTLTNRVFQVQFFSQRLVNDNRFAGRITGHIVRKITAFNQLHTQRFQVSIIYLPVLTAHTRIQLFASFLK